MTTLYGIKNCDTIKKARSWLESQQIDYQFHDFRSDGLSEQQLREWVSELGWEALVNKRSTTWKQLDNTLRDTMDEASAIRAMLDHPTLIKRPVLDTGHERHIGFKADQYQAIFKHHTL